ncbi:DUF4055 domain-containing protein [Marispirochaeta aestuarii]|uniref:DUF4055 domain-containing protein n=1 Tax=Marispirochaeta aestuarii TaxID=1963862 RepID=UPI002ABE831A|nr:DUF4055 domain-containing protein [Marispirochaeta aestuarii]
MPVTTEHKQYTDNLDRWRRNRDAVAGEDAVKARREAYLPKKSVSQTREEYDAYLQRALYFNATGRTVEGLVGLMFRRDAAVVFPDAMQEIMDDVTLDGISLQELTKQAAQDAVIAGRGGILVDYPTVDTKEVDNLRAYEKAGIRPYATYYSAEAITNWAEGRVGNSNVLTRVVLFEIEVEEKSNDEFESEEIKQYRVLDLTETGYRQRLFRLTNQGGSEGWTAVEEYYPLMNGKPLPYIPFEFIGPRYGETSVQKSPITDLAITNISHFRTMADLENGRHWCGSPTPVFTGQFVSESGDEVTEVKLGSESGIHMSEGSDAKYMEFKGDGLGELREADQQKRDMMVVLGARILSPDKRQTEAAETALIHRAGENSTLASIARSVSRSVTRIMEYLRDWSVGSGEVSCEINTDYMPTEMTPQELKETVAAWQSGALSSIELFERLKAGEIVRADKSYDEHQAEVESDGPPLGTLGGGFD